MISWLITLDLDNFRFLEVDFLAEDWIGLI